MRAVLAPHFTMWDFATLQVLLWPALISRPCGLSSSSSRALHLCNHRCVAAEAVELELSATLLPCRAVQAHSVPGSGLVIPTECSMFLPRVSHALLLKARLAFVVRW